MEQCYDTWHWLIVVVLLLFNAGAEYLAGVKRQKDGTSEDRCKVSCNETDGRQYSDKRVAVNGSVPLVESM